MIYPQLDGLAVEPDDLCYAILLWQKGSVDIVLVDQKIWDSWSDEEDASQFIDNIPARFKMEFTELHQFVNFCTKHGIRLQDSVVDYGY